MNLFDLLHTEQPQKGIVRTKQGGWAGTVDVGDVVNITNETFRVVGPPRYKTKMLRGEVESGYVLIEPDGHTRYYDMQGKYHRDNGPAVSGRGNTYWYRHGQLHREDGPAVIYADGTEMWYRNNEPHREDGPARTWDDGAVEYWIHGKRVNEEDLL